MRKTPQKRHEGYLQYREASKRPTTLCASDARAILNCVDNLLYLLDNAYEHLESGDMRQLDVTNAIENVRKDTIEDWHFMLTMRDLLDDEEYTPRYLMFDADDEQAEAEQDQKGGNNDNA